MPKCCKQMKCQLEDERVAICYYPNFREYNILVIDWCIPKEEIESFRDIVTAYQNITYCPWCGKKLPENLSDKWFEILENEYGLNEPLENKNKIPEEFKSDEWWKKRNL